MLTILILNESNQLFGVFMCIFKYSEVIVWLNGGWLAASTSAIEMAINGCIGY